MTADAAAPERDSAAREADSGSLPQPDASDPRRADNAGGQPAVLEAAAAALPQVLKILGSVVAPTTLLTALLFYFGRLHVTGLFRYLGVQYTVLDLTVQDYLIRSADGLFQPLTVVAVLTLAALWAHRLLLGSRSAATAPHLLRVVAAACGGAGLVLVGVALVDSFGTVPGASRYPEIGGVSLVIGVLLLAYAVRLVRLLMAQRRPAHSRPQVPAVLELAEWGVIFILVSVGLFWAVGSYAIAVGTGRGRQIETSLATTPDVVLYSARNLSLQAPGVHAVVCQDPQAAYRYRYDGLKLVLQSGDQYLFLPAGWTHATGPALLVPRSDALRLEFSAPGTSRPAAC